MNGQKRGGVKKNPEKKKKTLLFQRGKKSRVTQGNEGKESKIR